MTDTQRSQKPRPRRSRRANIFAAKLDDVRLAVERVTQEDPLRYCAPACIQMALKAFGVNRSQAEIWNATRALLAPQSVGVWYTDPQAVGSYLASVPEVSSTVAPDDIAAEQFTFALNRIVRTIVRYRTPVPMLVWSGGHWVTAAGAQVDFEDASRERGSVSGLWIADPSRGEQGITFKPLNQYFRERYFTPSRIPRDTLWKERLVIVGETNDSVDGGFQIVERPSGGGGVVSRDDVTDVVLGELGFYGIGTADRILGGGVAMSEPLTVNVIGTDDEYFIAPIALNDRIAWAVFVSKSEGMIFNDLTSVMYADLLEIPPSAVELRQTVATALGLGADDPFVEVPGLWWKRCVELPSLYAVVRIVETGGGRYFVPADGRVLSTLHDIPDEFVLAG